MSRVIAANAAAYAPVRLNPNKDLVILRIQSHYNQTFYLDYLWTSGLIHNDSFEDISNHEARRQRNGFRRRGSSN